MAFYDFPYIGNSKPNWRTHIFQRVRSTTNQYLFIHLLEATFSQSQLNIVTYILSHYVLMFCLKTQQARVPLLGASLVSVVEIPGHLKLNMNLCFQESLGNRYKLHLKTTSRGPCSANCAFCCERFAIFYNNFGGDLCDLLSFQKVRFQLLRPGMQGGLAQRLGFTHFSASSNLAGGIHGG